MPAYRASPAYFSQVNVSNTVINRNVNITNVYNNVYVNKTVNVTNVTYANQRVNGAVMAVPQNAMGNGRPVAQSAVSIPANQMASAQVQQGPGVAPQRAAVMGGRTAVNTAPPAAVMNRSVVARATPPPAAVPFAQQQSALQANPGQPLPRTQLNQMRPASPTGADAGSFGGNAGRPQYRQVQASQAAPVPAVQNNPQPNAPLTPRPVPATNTQQTQPPPRFNNPPPAQPQVNTNQERPATQNTVTRPTPAYTSTQTKAPPPQNQGKQRPKQEGKREKKKRD